MTATGDDIALQVRHLSKRYEIYQRPMDMVLEMPTPAIIFWGEDQTQIYNDGYARTLGPDRHPWALGRTAREVCGEAWDWLAPELERVVRRGESLQFSHRGLYVRGRGAEGDACLTHSHTPIREADGRIVGSLSVVRDTTRERDARRMFDLSPELLSVSDTNDRYRSVNPAFTRLTGYASDEVLGLPHDVELAVVLDLTDKHRLGDVVVR